MCWQSVTAERGSNTAEAVAGCSSQLVFGQQRSFRSKQDRSKWHAMLQLQLQLLLRRPAGCDGGYLMRIERHFK